MGDGGVDNLGWKDGKGSELKPRGPQEPLEGSGRRMCGRNEVLQGLQLGLATPTPGRDGVDW